MTRQILRVLSFVFACLFLVLGIGAVIGGNFAHGYVGDQLQAQKITMPSGDALKTPEMKAALEKYAGQEMSTGPQAEAFANHYIQVHMNDASQGRTYEEVSGEYIQCSRNPETAQGEDCQKLGNLRQTLFMGDSLRGMLLTAYAWWTVGSIALWGGVALIVLAVVLTVLALTVFKPRDAAASVRGVGTSHV